MRLNQRTVDTLKLDPGKREFITFDETLPGFGLRLREGGSRIFVVQYSLRGRTRRMTLGSTALLRADQARATATEILAKVKLGNDPAGAKTVAKIQAGETFAVVVKRYLEWQKTRLRATSYVASERYLLSHCAPFHPFALTHIDRRAIAERLSAIAANGPAAADQCRARLSAFFAWAMKRGLVDANPVIATDVHSVAKGGRTRVLTLPELVEVWNAAATVSSEYAALVRLLILTGQRRAEIGSLAWSEVDLAESVIRLPAERSKNHQAHLIPLAPAARAILGAVPRVGDFVLGVNSAGFSSYSHGKVSLDARIAAERKACGREPMPSWTVHDLRRSLSTHMNEQLGVQPHIVEAVLNHISHKAGPAAVYNRATYENEKRRALDLWADHVMAAVEGRASNVMAIDRRALA
jgi:integrase